VASPVSLERDGALAVMTLSSPPLNLFDEAMFDGVRAAVDEVAADPPRGLLVRAEGRVVSGGVDVALFDGLSVGDAAAWWRELLALVHTVEELPLPTVFAAHALCLTAAFELALACGLLVAAESARFGLVETVVGLTPAMGGTQRMAERAGSARAREFVYSGALYDAPTLHAWGVVNRVLGEDELLGSARAFARELAAGPTQAHAATKRIVRAQADHGTRGADERTASLTSHLFETQDSSEAVQAFLQHGGPGHATFTGK
jgi:enoyl-CoA hydratase